jgi:hypothetical protein
VEEAAAVAVLIAEIHGRAAYSCRSCDQRSLILGVQTGGAITTQARFAVVVDT